MRTSRLPIVLVTLALFSCEPPESANPLTDRATAKADARLAGTFQGVLGEEDAFVRLVPTEGPSFDLVLVGSDGRKGAVVLTYDAFPSTVAGKTYLNLRRKIFTDTYAEKFELAPEYTFARYDIKKDGSLSIWTMEDDLVLAAVKAGALKGTVGDPVKLTASSAELAAFVEKANDAELFRLFGTFSRVKSKAPKKR